MDWLKARLAEPTTWLGIGAVLYFGTRLGGIDSATAQNAITAAVAAIKDWAAFAAGIVGIVLAEKGK